MHETLQHPPTPPAPTALPRRRRRRFPRPLLWTLALVVTAALACLGYFLLTVFVFFNVHDVVPGRVYRSAQPSPAFLESFVAGHHIACVLKLNNTRESDWSAAEPAVAKRLGLDFRHVPIGVTELPPRQKLIDIVHIVDAAPRPLLIHCKTGADRTGLVAAMIEMHDRGKSFDDATADELRFRYLHLGHLGEAVEDVVTQYRADCAACGVPTGGWAEFKRYVLEDYYPGFYHCRVQPAAAAEIAGTPGQHIDVPVTVTNLSPRPWRTTSSEPFHLTLGSALDSDKPRLADEPLPNLLPGRSVTVTAHVTIPQLPPGRYEFPWDVARGTRTSFSLKGSDPVPAAVVVK